MNIKNPSEYFLDKNYSSTSNTCAVCLDFSASGKSSIPNKQYDMPSSGISGIISSIGNFWQTSGYGYLDNNYISLTKTGSEISFESGTYFMVYNNLTNGGCTLLSTINTGILNGYNYNLGFELGVTANNCLYFEYYDSDGPKCFTSDKYLSNKNSIFLSMGKDIVSFGYYDFFKNKVNLYSVNITLNSIFSPSSLYIGKNPNNTFSFNKQFTGYIEQFLIFNSQTMGEKDISCVNSGFLYNLIPSYTGTYITNFSGVTGYTTGSYVYFSGVTGKQLTSAGLVTNKFCITYSGQSVQDMTGVLTGIKVTPQYGIVSTINTGFFPTNVIYKTGYSLIDYGKSIINIISTVRNTDHLSIYIPDSGYNPYYYNNVSTKYDYVKNRFSYFETSNQINANYLVFVNGLNYVSGLTNTIVTPYANIINQTRDYYVDSNNTIILNGSYSSNDNVQIDYITGDINTGLYIENFYLGCSGTKEVKNLMNYSENLSANWAGGIAGATLLTNKEISPNSTNTATMFSGLYNTAQYIVSPGFSTENYGKYTFSIYAKSGNCKYCALRIQGGYPSIVDAVFDLSNGTVSKTDMNAGGNPNGKFGPPNASITKIGNSSWYRLSLSTAVDTWGQIVNLVSFNSNNIVLDGTDVITNRYGYIWGAQFESGSSLGEYVSTNGSVNSSYSLPWDSNKYNIFYNGQKLSTGDCFQLNTGITNIIQSNLAYTTGNNLLSYSNNFNKWYGYFMLPLNLKRDAIDPYGNYNNAWSFPLTGCNGNGGSWGGFICTEALSSAPIAKHGDILTASVWLKTDNPNGFQFIKIGFNDCAGQSQPVNTNWQRFSYTYTFDATCSTGPRGFQVVVVKNNGLPTGNVFIYGAQLEKGSSMNSYNETYNTTSSIVTSGIYLSQVSPIFSGSSGNLYALPRNFNINITGTGNSLYNTPKFYNEYSEVYKNGIRLNLNDDYIEVASGTLVANPAIFDKNVNLIYNNNDLFS